MTKNILLMASAVALLTVAPCALAAEPMSMEEMQRQLEALTAQVQKLSTVVEEQSRIIQQQSASLASQDAKLVEQTEKISQQDAKLSEQTAAVENLAAIAPAAGEGDTGVKITMKPSPKIESADGQFSFKPTGRVHVDYSYFEDDDEDHSNNANLRRARLGFQGDLGEDFNYKLEVDFGRNAVSVKDAWLEYTGLAPVALKLGNFKPPVGLEQNTSSNYIQFVESATPATTFTRDEILGAMASGGGENWSLAAGVFNESPGNVNANDDEAVSADVRGSVDMLSDSPDVFHLGAGLSYRSPNSVNETVTLSARATGVGNNLVSTGAIADVDHEIVYNAETAAVFGPVNFQGEYFWDQIDADEEAGFEGWYAQAGWFLTGERRPYSGKSGSFGRIKPETPFSPKNGGWGAWEVLGRYEELDLNDIDSGITGGELDMWTVGLNWYMTDYIRLMANYISVNTDHNAVVANDDPEIVNLRAQWDF